MRLERRRCTISSGAERHSGHPTRAGDVRWWFYLEAGGTGFVFARGGRADTETEAQLRLLEAWDEAEAEARHWVTHALLPSGQLLPVRERIEDRHAIPERASA